MVLFDRSWYNRAGVERVMGFCTEEEYREFLRSCPEFERMLVRSGIILVKYWFSVSDEEQERRFQSRIEDPTKRWKLSPMDLESRARWVEYSKAKDEMFAYTDIKQAPWYVVNADDKKRARLNVIRHLLSLIPYEDLTPEPIVLPPRQPDTGYIRPPITRPDLRARGLLTGDPADCPAPQIRRALDSRLRIASAAIVEVGVELRRDRRRWVDPGDRLAHAASARRRAGPVRCEREVARPEPGRPANSS